jgi:hypothetical protein
MEPPLPVRKAIERIQLDISSRGDETLVAAWVEWSARQGLLADREKWQSRGKR